LSTHPNARQQGDLHDNFFGPIENINRVFGIYYIQTQPALGRHYKQLFARKFGNLFMCAS